MSRMACPSRPPWIPDRRSKLRELPEHLRIDHVQGPFPAEEEKNVRHDRLENLQE